MRGQPSLRRADPGDAARIAALHAESWRRHYRGAFSDPYLDGDVEADRLSVWTERLRSLDGTAVTILAEDDGELVGFVHVVYDADPAWGSLVDNLHVDHERRRGGVGARLMAEGAAAVIARGPGGLHVWVLERNADAQAFYGALGGRRVERAHVPPPGGIPDRLVGEPYGFRYAWSDPGAVMGAR